MASPESSGVDASPPPTFGRDVEPSLWDLKLGERGELVEVDLAPAEAEPLFERGVVPGCRLAMVRRSPSGDPIVEVDGALLALRRETARGLRVKRIAPSR